MTRKLIIAKRFLNGDLVNRTNLVTRMMFPGHYYRATARKLCSPVPEVTASSEIIQLDLKIYTGSDPHVLGLREFISKENSNDLVSVLLHGSIASGDVIPYSDFDAIAVVRDDLMNDPQRMARMARTLYRGRRYFHEFDPLQHHGWMIITESELKDPGNIPVPLSLLRSSLVITGSTQLFVTAGNHLPEGNLNRIRQQITNIINSGKFPTSRYSLKSILSEFMLTPALYLQERYRIDITKKESFERARTDFDPDEYSIMDEVSALRNNWRPDVSSWRIYMMKKLRMLPGAMAGRFSGRAAEEILAITDKAFQRRMIVLLDSMNHKLRSAG